MSRRCGLPPALGLLLALLLEARSGLASPQAAAAPPNIFFILVDDLGYADVGFNRAKPGAPHQHLLACHSFAYRTLKSPCAEQTARS